MEDPHDLLPGALEHLHDRALRVPAPPGPLDPDDDPIAVERGAEARRGDEHVGSPALQDREPVAGAGRLQLTHDEVDPLREGVAALLDAIEASLRLHLPQEVLQLAVAGRVDVEAASDLFRLERAVGLLGEESEDGLRAERFCALALAAGCRATRVAAATQKTNPIEIWRGSPTSSLASSSRRLRFT